MSSARSTKGCYTCRFRKKKCGEQRPICLNCKSRGIQCYGYESKPDWLKRTGEPGWDNKLAQELRRAAERNHKARKSNRAKSKAPAPENGDNGPCLPTQMTELSIRDQPSQAANSAIRGYPPPALGYASLMPMPKDSIWWDGGLKNQYGIHSTHEVDLLMTYLDDVFPLQFGFYKASSGLHARGWILNLLFRSKPVLYASTSLAEGLRLRIQAGGNPTEIQPNTELQRLNTLTLCNVQKQVDLLSGLSGPTLVDAVMEAEAAIIQLMSLEVSNLQFVYRGATQYLKRLTSSAAFQRCRREMGVTFQC
jgi:hypothetical protein